MGQAKHAAEPVTPSQPRHALEAADAGGHRTIAAIRRVAGRIATALGDASESTMATALCFAVANHASGRRDQFDSMFDSDADIAAITIEPVHAPALLVADPGLATLLVERHYGGRIGAPAHGKARVGGLAGVRAFARMADAVALALQQSCEDRVPVGAAPLGAMGADDARDLITAGEAVARIDFQVTAPPLATPYWLTIMLPLAALRAATVLQMALTVRDPASRSRWQGELARRAGDIAMPARSIIARPLLSMPQLMALRPGDVIPIGMPRRVPLLVADRRVATGTIGERDGRAAFMIDQLDREDAQ
jgi:flagellar motor switch protein FliM